MAVFFAKRGGVPSYGHVVALTVSGIYYSGAAHYSIDGVEQVGTNNTYNVSTEIISTQELSVTLYSGTNRVVLNGTTVCEEVGAGAALIYIVDPTNCDTVNIALSTEAAGSTCVATITTS